MRVGFVPRAFAPAEEGRQMTNFRSAGRRQLDLANGRRVLTRRLLPDDTHLLSEMGKLCSPEDLRFRFLHAVGSADEKALRQLTDLDPRREIALVAFDPPDTVPLAVVRLHGDQNGHTAEFAILVRSDQQGRGLGRAMMHLMIDCARNRGLSIVEGQVLSDNVRMLDLSSSLGFSKTNEGCGVTAVRLDLESCKPVQHSTLPRHSAVETVQRA